MNLRQLLVATFLASGLAAAGASAQQPAPPDGARPSRPERPPTPLGTRPQEFYLSKVTVSDLVRSYAFYTEVIGLKPAKGPNGEGVAPPTATDPEKAFVEYPLNFTGSLADPIFVLTKLRGVTPSPEVAKTIVIGFKVPNVREALARAAQAGYPMIGRPPADTPMAFGNISDPDGYHIELIQAPSYPAR